MRWLDSLKAWRQERRRARKFRKRQEWSKGLDVEQTFEKIYTERKWGRSPGGAPFYSGDGSRPEASSMYEAYVAEFLNAHPELRSVADIGCGDFQVSDRILRRLKRPIDYIGCDVARSVVEHNTATHTRAGVRFLHVNAVTADPPAADVVSIRQVLQHLSNEQISAVLNRLKRLYKVAIITESLPAKLLTPNLDISHGIAVRIPLGSGVYVDLPPYDLAISDSLETPYSEKEYLRTSLVWLQKP